MASTTARTRQTTAARRAKPKPTPLAAGPDFEPIRIEADEDVVDERVPLFYIGDTEYTIPKEIPSGAALQYLRVAGERGEQFAAPILLTRVLGEDAYSALEESKGLTDKQLEQIIQLVVDLSLGRREKQEGKAR